MIKTFRIWLSFIYLATVSFLYFIPLFVKPFWKNHVHYVGKLIGLGRLILGINLVIKNKEVIATHPPCVFISNHQHNIDVFIGGSVAPHSTVTIGKKSILYLPFFGIVYFLSGNILINRSNKKSAYETMDSAADSIRKKELSVWIMPEGTRSNGRGLLPFKKGAFVTAIKAQVPIYPIAISEFHKTLNFNKLVSGKVLVEALEPISTQGLTMNDVDELRKIVEDKMRVKIQQLNQEANHS